jgi:lipopolysaccharide heptosyltransferase II
MDLQSVQNLMIRLPNWVGDAVMSEPALRELRRIFGGARITHVARPWVAGLFDGEALADHQLSIAGSRRATIGAFINDVRLLKRERFDAGVLLQNAFGAALRARAAGIKTLAGYPTDGRRFLLSDVVRFETDYKTRHHVRYYLNIAAEIERMMFGKSAIDFDKAQPRLRVSEEQKRRAFDLVFKAAERQGISWSPAKPLLAINPGATNSRAKQWLPERFAEVGDLMNERDGFQTLIIGSPGDVDAGARVMSMMKTRPISIVGQTAIGELKGVLACSALLVSNDTGAAHVSAALGVPTVIVFGPTEHIATRPLSSLASIVRHDVECSPCMLRDCPIDHRCMVGVSVELVYQSAERLLLDRHVAHENL